MLVSFALAAGRPARFRPATESASPADDRSGRSPGCDIAVTAVARAVRAWLKGRVGLCGIPGRGQDSHAHPPECSQGTELAERVDLRAVWDAFCVRRVVMPPGLNLPVQVLNALATAAPPAPLVTAYRHDALIASPAGPGADDPPVNVRQDAGREIEL